MGIAFEMALASLGSTPGCDDPIRKALAQGIIVPPPALRKTLAKVRLAHLQGLAAQVGAVKFQQIEGWH
jgi:hypothetical protein